MPKTRLYLFDIDCTLLWSQGAGRVAMGHAMLEVFGFRTGIDSHEFAGKTDWLSLVELLAPRGYGHDDIARIMPEYDRAMGKHLARIIGDFDVQPCPGAPDVVAQLRNQEDALLALVTGNVGSSAPIKLRAAGYDPAHFAVGAYGSEAMDRDALPPLALARAIEHHRQNIPPEQVIVIGDTPADVQCARALGAVAVAVRTGYCKPGELEASKADFLLDDLTQFAEVLSNLGD
ncbi:MAG: HAD family hydrolase [Anaerolineae bacterium]|nr:HAD family hydrolase [Anaerolineae bacterium]